MVGTSRPQRSQSSSVRSMPTRPAMAEQVDHRVGRAADRAVGADRVLEGLLGQDVRGLQVVLDHLHDPPPGQLRHHAAAAVHRRDRGVARQRHAQRLGHARPWCEAVPMVLQDPGERLIEASASSELLGRHLAGLHGLGELPQMRARADPLAPEIAVQHRPAGDDDGRQVAGRRAPSAATAWSCRSRPAARTPSIGWPRIASSTAMAARLRNIIAVGRKALSEAENTGTSTGKPPAS